MAGADLVQFRLFQGNGHFHLVLGIVVVPQEDMDSERIGVVNGELDMQPGRHVEFGLQFRIVGAAHDPGAVAAFRQHAVACGCPSLEGFRGIAQVGFLFVEADVPHVVSVDGKQAAPGGFQLKGFRIQGFQRAV